MNPKVEIISNRCRLCLLCVEVCPNRIFELKEQSIVVRTARIELCFACGHCMAVCKNAAVKVNSLDYHRDFFELNEMPDASQTFKCLLESRRSVRVFSEKPVPDALLREIVNAISLSPPSFPPAKTELIVVNGRQKLEAALPYMITLYDKLVKGLQNPVARTFIKRKMGSETYCLVKSHLLPLLKLKLPYMLDGSEDAITRGAPACILFHADRNAGNAAADIYIAVGFAILTAHSLGLGATVVDLIGPAVDRTPELRKMFNIPENNSVFASVILGYPKFRFSRGIKRELKTVVYI